LLLLFFFFQAEDGIRDFHVTGVQTCALPILAEPVHPGSPAAAAAHSAQCGSGRPWESHPHPEPLRLPPGPGPSEEGPAIRCRTRSEERRVGKGCRRRWVAGCATKTDTWNADR